jgi:hypothetical protein
LTIHDIDDKELTSSNVIKILKGQSIMPADENNHRRATPEEIKDACKNFMLKTLNTPSAFTGLNKNQKKLVVLAAKQGKIFEGAGYDVIPF